MRGRADMKSPKLKRSLSHLYLYGKEVEAVMEDIEGSQEGKTRVVIELLRTTGGGEVETRGGGETVRLKLKRRRMKTEGGEIVQEEIEESHHQLQSPCARGGRGMTVLIMR